MRGKKPRPPKTLGELIARRRQELGLRQVEMALRIKGRGGTTVTQEMIASLEGNSRKKPGMAIIEQLPRALKLEVEVIYFWGGQIPPDIRPSGLSEATVQEAWAALRAVLADARATSGKPASGKRRPKRPRGTEALHGRGGRRTLGALIGWRRRKLRFTSRTLSQHIKGSSGEAVSKQRISDLEYDRFGVPRRSQLSQLARALKLDIDVLYLWAGRLPPDMRPGGLSERTIRKGWKAFRAVISGARRRAKQR